MVALSFVAFVSSLILLKSTMSGKSLPGCGPGTSCDEVTTSRWSRLGPIPTTLPGTALYLAMLAGAVMVALPNSAISTQNAELARRAATSLAFCSLLAAGAAVWFIALQAIVIQRFCRYCMVTHLSALAAGIIALRAEPPSQGVFIAAAAVLGLFIIGQIAIVPRMYAIAEATEADETAGAEVDDSVDERSPALPTRESARLSSETDVVQQNPEQALPAEAEPTAHESLAAAGPEQEMCRSTGTTGWKPVPPASALHLQSELVRPESQSTTVAEEPSIPVTTALRESQMPAAAVEESRTPSVTTDSGEHGRQGPPNEPWAAENSGFGETALPGETPSAVATLPETPAAPQPPVADGLQSLEAVAPADEPGRAEARPSQALVAIPEAPPAPAVVPPVEQPVPVAAPPAPAADKPPRRIHAIGKKVSLSPHLWPVIGNRDAKHIIIDQFDYTCHFCRDLHKLLMKAIESRPDDLAVLMMPVPMDTACNPMVKTTPAEHRDACIYARYAMGVFRAAPEKFAEMDAWLFEPMRPWDLDLVKMRAEFLAGGPEKLAAAMNDPWMVKRHNEALAIYDASTQGQLPKMLFEHAVVSGPVPNYEQLLDVFEKVQLFNPNPANPQ